MTGIIPESVGNLSTSSDFLYQLQAIPYYTSDQSEQPQNHQEYQ